MREGEREGGGGGKRDGGERKTPLAVAGRVMVKYEYQSWQCRPSLTDGWRNCVGKFW